MSRSASQRPRALLLWPGGLLQGGGNFGVPQLLSIAGVMRPFVDVDVVDLDAERVFGAPSLDAILARGGPYDLVGIACYSSFDYLKVVALAEAIRARLSRAWIVTGGYHASARPEDFGDPFDFVAIGDGEGPMARLAEALVSGRRPLLREIGPLPVGDPSTLPPVDWSLLERYRPRARSVAAQAEIYLSRGCPYDCAFCMERAKRDTSWRALDPLHAVEELHRLDAFLDLSSWTLFIADALFGMKTTWRRTFLEALAARPIRARKIWLLVRLDLLEREDLVLMARANVGPGFGLESGDPDMVRRIRKVGRLSDYLDQMLRVAGWARELDVPWGANVIVGHPGETEASLRTTARYLERLFLGPGGTTGFLSVDPFRLYPGSPIDEERGRWEADTGMRVHRYPWWHDGDPDFLAEWVDPSGTLDYRRCHELRHRLFRPILDGIARSFRYQGPAPEFFRAAIDEQVRLHTPAAAARTLSLEHMWSSLLGKPKPFDAYYTETARAARGEALAGDDAITTAILDTPREAFVPLDVLPDAHLDLALPLNDAGTATISALHAYAQTFRLLELAPGDRLVDLGGGSGFGAAVAARIVANVTMIEIDPALPAPLPENVEVVIADAHDTARWAGATKVSAGFDPGALPASWVAALGPGGRLVAPIAGMLVVVDKAADGTVSERRIAPVLYVRDRSERAEVERGEPRSVRAGEAGGARA